MYCKWTQIYYSDADTSSREIFTKYLQTRAFKASILGRRHEEEERVGGSRGWVEGWKISREEEEEEEDGGKGRRDGWEGKGRLYNSALN